MIRENGNNWITKDRGSITYPLNGSVYENRKSCIWQIRPKTPNKYIKVIKFNFTGQKSTNQIEDLKKYPSLIE